MAGTSPSLAGFLGFIRTVMGIDPAYLPDNSPVIGYALSVALAVVNPALAAAGCGPTVPGIPSVSIYTLAVYNLAGDNVINFAPDQEGRTYFTDLRAKLDIAAFVPGTIQTSADQSTSESLLNPEFMKNFTMANLQNVKTMYGRQYLAFAQSYGPSVWGLS